MHLQNAWFGDANCEWFLKLRRHRSGRKAFFFGKKKQKTFISAVADHAGKSRDSARKSFLVLFFKKEHSSRSLRAWPDN
jgi:hypothetical protein